MTKKELLKILEEYNDDEPIRIQVQSSIELGLVIGKPTCTTEGHTVTSINYDFLDIFQN